MDPPHAPPITAAPPLTTAQTTTTTPATTIPQPYTDSIDSSPHSRATDFDDAPPTTTTTTITTASSASKLRLMCSYGGHIVPRPHTKSLCYVGGDTRMVVVDRSFTLSDLLNYLSKTLNFAGNHHNNNNRRKPPFTLKYQLPNEDLDSLITVSTDEDLDNMIDEYDRLCSTVNAGKSGRIRLFLFPVRPEGAQSMGPILDGSNRSEDWFVSALNGTSELHRGFSDPNSVNCLLGLDHDVEIVNPNYLNLGSDGNSNSNNTSTGGGNNNTNNNNSNNNNINNNNNNGINNNHNNNGGGNLKGEMVGEGLGGKKLRNSSAQDVQSVPDSPIVETTSSFGSGSSLPSLGSLPQIRVHADDGATRFMEQRGGGGIEEQFAQMNVNGVVGGGGGGSGGAQVQKVIDEGFMVMSSPHSVAVGGGGDFGSRVYVDDLGFGKQQQQQQQMGQGGGVMSLHAPPKQQHLGGELPSPDSVASDGSLTGAIARQKPVMYQDANGQLSSGSNMFPPGMPMHQVHESGYALLQQSDQVRQVITQRHQNQQFVQQYHPQQQQTQTQPQPQAQPQYIPAGQHFVHHPPPGAVPMPAYYPVYPSQNHPHQYPIYYVPAGPSQGYSVPGQQQPPNMVEAPTSVPANRNQAPPNPTILTNSAYNPTRNMNLQPVNSDLGPAVYGTTTGAGGPQLVQVPSSLHQTSSQSQSQSQPQQQHQYVGYSQVHHPQQSVAPNSGAGSGYTYEFADPAHPKMYFTQPLAPVPATAPAPAPVPASQYQGMTSAGPTMIISDGSSQLSNDSIKQQT